MRTQTAEGVKKLKKTSINLDEETWRRFRARCVMEGREAGVTLAELIEAWLSKRKGGERGKR
jgi:ParG